MIAVTDGKDIHSLVANGTHIVVNLILNFSLIHYTARHELSPDCILLDKKYSPFLIQTQSAPLGDVYVIL